ncbi:TRAP transporter small permease [Thioclava atlantica]|uniref:TRAP transporter small permease protein n=1 Tax=Thioclava atlantica TaxID=1317124 RepID=A0A085TWA5_9RHOB|nr:TRAP transporter small permease [Thioclava atlantica]KFE35002.1 tripartite ATP-independent periplasmic transporter DctQ [Thioclava atlantica]
MSQGYEPRSRISRAIHHFEETMIALILGVMTVITFINVILRYIFNDSLIWGLEVTLILFAWLVLFGMSYAVKITAHLGVDAVINMLRPGPRRLVGLFAAALCILYAVLLLKGAWDYWAPFAGLEQTGGRWFPTGFVATRDRAFYETDQVPFAHALAVYFGNLINQGEAYDKLPRFIPYVILPVGVLLLLIRFIQATIGIARGDRTALIVSHEAEDQVADVAHMNKDD